MALIYPFTHAVVDGVCAATLFSFGNSYEDFNWVITLFFLYSGLAFATQGIVGLWMDSLRTKEKLLVLFSLSILLLGSAFHYNFTAQVVFLGIGNSLFHVAAGSHTIQNSNGKIAPLGVFVAPGAIGLALGTTYFEYWQVFVLAVFVCLAVVYYGKEQVTNNFESPAVVGSAMSLDVRVVLSLVVLFCITGRSLVSTNTADVDALTVGCLLCAGKMVGGIIADCWGMEKTLLGGALVWLIVEVWNPALGNYAKLLCWNLSMPVTLYLMYKLLPNRPALAFGLAATFLFPGFLISELVGKGLLPGMSICLQTAVLIGVIFVMRIGGRGVENVEKEMV